MMYRTHITGGLVAGELLAIGLGCDSICVPAGAILLGSTLGSLFPDIDHSQSFISRSSLLFRAASAVATGISTHRGFFHTVIAGALWALLLLIPSVRTALGGAIAFAIYGFLAGYLSHLVLDTLNPHGIMWFWPFSRKRIHLANIRTGGRLELGVRVVLVAAMIALGVVFAQHSVVLGVWR